MSTVNPTTHSQSKTARRQPRIEVPSGLPTPVAEAVAAYTPESVSPEDWAAVRQFTVSLLAILLPETKGAASKCLSVLAPYVVERRRAGTPLAVDALFTRLEFETQASLWREQVERGANTRWSMDTVADYSSRLQDMGRRLNRAGGWHPPRQPLFTGRSLRAPYSDEDLGHIWDALGTYPDRRKAQRALDVASLVLGTGAFPRDLVTLVGSDVVHDDFGRTLVRLAGPRDTVVYVPVVSTYIDTVVRRAQAAGDGQYIEGAKDTESISNMLAKTRLGTDAPRLSMNRLRTTWLLHRLRNQVPLNTLRHYARLESYHFLRELPDYLPAIDAEESAWLLIKPADGEDGQA